MQTLVQMIYPPRCISCGSMVDTDFGLCSSCWKDTPFISGLSCDHCGTPLPGNSRHAELCDECLSTPRPWQHGRAAILYKGRGRRLVLGLKHGDRYDIAKPAAQWMARLCRPLVTPDTLIAPVPLHLHRLLSRRYNQSALLAEELATLLKLDWCPDLIERRKPTPSLDGKSREDRFETLQGVLRVPDWRTDLIADRPVLIVDDVMTTGATMTAATDACLAAGATQVNVAVLARVVKDT
ncbi:MAG: double zinc ribbon domain-containing protein [Pelagimonas sp.]|nr:double zinc ribbon domain-containing protein [Pelagimonas sp.]